MYSPEIGTPDGRHLKLAPRAGLVPFFAASALRPVPGSFEEFFILADFWIDRRLAGKLRRYLNHCFIDQDGYRVEITSVCFEPETLCLQRQCPTAREGIVKGRQLLGIVKV